MSDIAIVSVTTRNYFYRTRVLFDAVAKHLPEARRIVLCADRLDGACDPAKEAFEIVEAASLDIPLFLQWALALNPTALCCALKPHALGIALKDPGIQRVIYIDNDMGLYRRPEEMLRALESASFVLTPHHLRPLPAAAVPSERTLVTYGVFNAGIFGMRRCAEVELFLEWWSDWMLDPRHLENAMGYDQVWLNYVPVYCPRAEILRDPAYNVAFWNVHERHLKSAGGDFYCGDQKLTTFHFSNFDDNHANSLVWPLSVSNYTLTEATVEIAADIATKWAKSGKAESLALGYGFAKWPDGTEVTPKERQAFCALWDEMSAGLNPWSVDFQIRFPDLYQKIRRQALSHKNPIQKRIKTTARWILDLSLRKIIKAILHLF